MKYGIFDSRPKFSNEPFMFLNENDGTYEPAIFDDKEKAEKMTTIMNGVTTVTTFVVKEMG